LKDYDHVVLWLDYFNKNLKRRQGRKVNRDQAVFDPTVQELSEAAKAAGFQFSEQEVNNGARYPKKEGVKKSKVIEEVADKMVQKRSRQKTGKK